jgi:hypothetical protein
MPAKDIENFLGIMSAFGFQGTEHPKLEGSVDSPERGVLVRMEYDAALALPIMHKQSLTKAPF